MNNVIPFRRNEPEPIPTSAVSSTDRLLIMLNATQERGMTWKDVAAVFEVNHGSASGLLSRTHRAGLILRLSEERDGCKVYVTPPWTRDRRTERPRRATDTVLLDDMAAVLRQVPTRCKHTFWNEKCRSCDVRDVLSRYDKR